MDLHTVNRVRHPARAEEIASWEAGFAWLAGGTWLFSEPQHEVHTLIDLATLNWPSLRASDDLAHGRARGRLYALAAEWRTAAGVRGRFRDGRPRECPGAGRITAIDL